MRSEIRLPIFDFGWPMLMLETVSRFMVVVMVEKIGIARLAHPVTLHARAMTL